MKVEMIKDYPLDGETLKAGEAYELNWQMAENLKRQGWAKDPESAGDPVEPKTDNSSNGTTGNTRGSKKPSSN
jgi:hypothetical protein